ncbi:CheR family methyltransferase [Flavimarina sp. Hel_I_48]|uniref:CheR family methyltransferase n=1 Tax=Flavimarina sp. Hel_I_48 TaxID=1392488 RepID=UPI00068974D9|nr:CheR family methyltransferase [Flavimarina sp. Hel_I_48]
MKQNNNKQGVEHIVLLGASAGGLKAFKEFLEGVKKSFSTAYILLQHLDPNHRSMLPELLQSVSSIPVVEISNGLTLESDTVYVLPSDKVPQLNKGVFSLHKKDSVTGSAHLIDDFFEIMAKEYSSKLIGVILSGTGSDGANGLRKIRERKGVTFVQEPALAEWSDMPESAINKGVVDFILPAAEIPQKIYELNITGNLDMAGNVPQMQQDSQQEEVLYEILLIMERRKGTDFSNYKKNTILRRVKRRQVLNGYNNLKDYLEYMEDNNDEISALFDDFLIPVTEFFRDQSTFVYLEKEIFPKLLANKDSKNMLRIWIPACSTGQEAYSIAICILDYIKKIGNDNPYGVTNGNEKEFIKIFATDLSSKAILRARKGIYQEPELKGVSNERLEAYFNKTSSGYEINKDIRSMCVFAEHDFLNDYPFGAMHLVSCRNALIYLNSELQEKALTNFHYALVENGMLLLGNSETINSVPELFNRIKSGYKIYRRSSAKRKIITHLAKNKNHKSLKPSTSAAGKSVSRNIKDYAEALLLKDYAPVAIVVNKNLNLVTIHSKTGKYLEHAPGTVSHNILKLAKGDLGFEIKRIIRKFNLEKDKTLERKGIKLLSEGRRYLVDISVSRIEEMDPPHFLVVFKDKEIEELPALHEDSDEKEIYIASLERELVSLKEEILANLEEHQVAEEELQSANEELMSSTEELQTLNEELETSKEELQSTVEEITIVNQELKTLNSLLIQEKKFSESIIRTIRNPLLILNKDFEVIMANRSFYKNFKVEESTTLGRLLFQLGNGQWDIPKLHTLLESILPLRGAFADYEVTHTFETLGKRTILLNGQILKEEAGQEESILLSFEDVTERNKAQKDLRESVNIHKEFIESSPWPIAVLKGEEHTIDIANESMLRSLRKKSNIIGQTFKKAMPELEKQGFFKLLDQVYKSGVAHEAFNTPAYFINEKGEEELDYFDYIYQPQRNLDGDVVGVSIITTVVTQQVILNEKIKKSEKQFRQLANHLPELIVSYDIKEKTRYFNKSFLKFTGMNVRELKEKSWYTAVHPDDYERMMREYGKKIENAENFEMELRIRNADGDYLWCLNKNHCVTDRQGEPIRWIGTNMVIQRIKDEEKRKEDFLKLVSHELKTPVTSIKGYVQMLLSMISKDPGKSINALPIESSLLRVENQITRLTHLISEMLDLSRVEESKLELNLEMFELCELVEETIQDVKHSNGMVPIVSDYIDDWEVRADKDRIGQVLINLITNAIKYSPKQKNIKVTVYNNEPGFIAVSVKDSGIGIGKEDLSKIFDRFYRVSGENEATYDGFGIGLYLAKEILDRHKGKIKVESTLGEGSNFIFSLPLE